MPYLDLETIFKNILTHRNNIVNYVIETLYSVQPDINGYVFGFFVPPDLSGYQISKDFLLEVSNFMTFAIVDITPPNIQINTESVNTRSGGIPYATEVTSTEQLSVTFVDDCLMRIYTFHHMWVKYIEEVTQGLIDPDKKYYNDTSTEFGAIDYFGSAYIVKYNPTVDEPLLIGYCCGIFPNSKPTKETIGARTSNEIVTLPITYFCTIYDEVMIYQKDHWIIKKFMGEIVPRFKKLSV
jgi:hypothetical protein